ncbi:MAG: cobalamin-dependent protein [Candidatus Aenigmarchaeota archaeon]|nr:cobalamin-dependent protein [Candidatus Aenigmarchaeota archaeon]
MFKILALNPPFLPKYSRQSRSPCVAKSGTLYQPYYLAYAAGALEKDGFDVRLIDAVARGWGREETIAFAKEFSPDLVVIDTSTPSIRNDIDVAGKIKGVVAGAHVSLVGTFPTNMSEECFKMGREIDSVCRGEYDFVVRGLARSLRDGKELHKVKGLSFRDGKGIVDNKDAGLIDDLDSLPFVSEIYLKHFGKEGIKKYFYASVTWPEIQILTARGCPYRCAFCLTPEMPVITDKGMHSIGRLIEGTGLKTGGVVNIDGKNMPRVLSHDGEFHNIDAVMKREFTGDIVVLKVQGIPSHLELTPNHKLYASREGKEPSPIRADNLSVGDYVALPRIRKTKDIGVIDVVEIVGTPTSKHKKTSRVKECDIKKAATLLKRGYSMKKTAILCGIDRKTVSKIAKGYQRITYHEYALHIGEDDVRYTYSKKPVPRRLKLDSGLLRLFGYYLAEGHVHKLKSRPNSKVLVFTFNKNETEYLEDIKKLVKMYFGLGCMISDTITAYQISVHSALVATLFEKLFGTGASNKKIPWGWLHLPEDKQISILTGYMRGDGYKIPKRIGFNTTSKILAEQLQLILNRMGFYHSLQVTKKGKYESNINGRVIKSKHDRYDVWVFGNAKERLNSLLGNLFTLDKKKVSKSKKWKRVDKYIFAPITKVSKRPYNGYVYNFSVKDSHSYTIHGVAVSNCNIPSQRSYRPRSIKNSADEFEYIQEKLPFVNEVMVEDDTFPADKKRTIGLCDELIGRDVRVGWSCNARVNTDLETMQKMREARCRLMCVGFESSAQSSLNAVTKGQTRGMQQQFMDNAKRAGLLINGCFIMGLPTDTRESMQATIGFAKELNPNSAQFYPLMVYPGTAAFEWAQQNNYLETNEWREWITPEGLHKSTVSRPGLQANELVQWCNKARLDFYTNPRFLGKMAKQAATNPREAVRIVKGGKVLFKHLVKHVTERKSKA